jgi:hypothetical protein
MWDAMEHDPLGRRSGAAYSTCCVSTMPTADFALTAGRTGAM